MRKTSIFIALAFFVLNSAFAQDPLRFEEEVSKFKNASSNYPKEHRIVFTGSSSIRLWVDFDSYFPNHNVINTGFGGSETSDLIHYQDLLIHQFEAQQVFIYEGDNDTNSGKSAKRVIKELEELVKAVQRRGVEDIVLISAKPSISRWALKKKYEKLNSQMAKLADSYPNVRYADVWSIMLEEDGEVKKDIFIEDDLHMNKKGYDLWIKVIEPLLLKN